MPTQTSRGAARPGDHIGQDVLPKRLRAPGTAEWPEASRGHVAPWDRLTRFVRVLDQHVKLWPRHQIPGIAAPLAGRRSDTIDVAVVRENAEGKARGSECPVFEGCAWAFVLQATVMARTGVEHMPPDPGASRIPQPGGRAHQGRMCEEAQ